MASQVIIAIKKNFVKQLSLHFISLAIAHWDQLVKPVASLCSYEPWIKFGARLACLKYFYV